MPFFDYVCPKKKCQHTEEFLLSRKDLDTEILCPECQTPMRRLMNAPIFQIEGQPPRDWTPLKKNEPRSHVRNIHEIRRVESK